MFSIFSAGCNKGVLCWNDDNWVVRGRLKSGSAQWPLGAPISVVRTENQNNQKLALAQGCGRIGQHPFILYRVEISAFYASASEGCSATGMATTVEISIAGRGEADAPLLGDLIEQIQDFFAMLNGVAETIAGDATERFDWKVVSLSKNSPARITVEAVALPGHADGPDLAARARDVTIGGLRQIISQGERPLYWNDNVIEAADRFLRRISGSLAATSVGSLDSNSPELTVGTAAAVQALKNVELVREAEPVHPYRELGSFEGYIQNVGTDGWGRPFIIVKSRLTGGDVKCFLSGEALHALEGEPVAQVVWRNRRVTAIGLLKYRSVGRLSQAEVSRLDFADPGERLPQLKDIIDPDFTHGLSSHDYLERVRNGEA